MIIVLLLFFIVIFYYFIQYKELYTIDDNLEIIIYDNTNSKNHGGYNLGDLLNMPHFFAGWLNNPHHNESLYNVYLESTKQFPNSVLYYYQTLRKDNEEPIPNLKNIEKAVDLYIENNDVNNIINNIENNALYVHLRTGDKGIVEDKFINIINSLIKDYDKIIILTGIHSDTRFSDIENSKKNLIESLKKINGEKINVNLDKADNHLVIMRKCKNLLVHKGGFSLLGSIIFNGDNLYITNLFECNNNSEIIDHIKNKKINLAKI